MICPQSGVIVERNDGRPALRMPGTNDRPIAPQSVWMMNELNEVLVSRGRH